MKPIRVLIADDHAILRAGVRLLVSTQRDMQVVGEAGDGAEVVELAKALKPDVVTLDLSMPHSIGADTVSRLHAESPQTRVLVLTAYDDPAQLQAVLAAGASGYVVKSAAETELLAAIRAVHQGRTFVNLTFSDRLVQTVLGKVPMKECGTVKPTALLSQREQEVVELLVQGYTNQEAADRLFLSVKTVETYRARLLAKLEMKSRADLVRYAVEQGLISQGKLKPV